MSHPHDAHPPYHDLDADGHDPHDPDAAAADDDDAFSTATSSSGGAGGMLPGDGEEEEEEEESCPLCMEPFDATDKEFTPCKCGYKICLWCWHSINNIYTTQTSTAAAASSSPASSLSSSLSSHSADRPPLAGRCPACRQPYVYPDRLFNADTLQSSLSNKQKRKASSIASSSSSSSTTARKPIKELDHRTLQHQQMRVLQRNLMYVLNIPPAIAKEEVLQERRFFGKFGKITHCKVAGSRKTTPTSSSTSSSSSASTTGYSAYITFKRPSDCGTAISLCHHTSLSGHTVKAMYGTTKYCAYYARGVPCTMVKCSYLHEPAKAEDVVGKEELAAMERYREHEKPTPFPLQLTVAEALSAAKASRAVQPAEEGELAESSKASAAPASAASSTAAPLASVWGTRPTQPVTSLFPAASSSSPGSPPTASTPAATPSSTPSPASPPSTASAFASSTSSSSSLRPYVSILAQSQSVTHPSPSAQPAPPASTSSSNEIIRIVPAFLKDKFSVTSATASTSSSASTSSPSASPTTASTAATAGKKKSNAAFIAAALSLSPVSSASSTPATPSIITASPSMSRSTSKASSSSSSRPSSPHHSPPLQPVDHSPSSFSPAPTSQSQSPHPPLDNPALPSSLPSSPTSSSVQPLSAALPASSSAVAPSHTAAAALPSVPRAPPSEDFDFLLYSLSDFTPFFHSYAADDPHFSWLLDAPHARSYPLRLARRSSAATEATAPEAAKEGVTDAREGEEGAKGSGERGGVLQEADRRVRLEKEREMGWDEQKGVEGPITSPSSSPPAIAVRGGHRSR